MPALEIRVTGTVQGVGFRPTVHRLAHEERLAGEVRNDGAGVRIEVEGEGEAIARFVARLRAEAPPLARIESIDLRELGDGHGHTHGRGHEGFEIVASAGGQVRTRVAPDAALCAACRAEILEPTQRRFEYPFANCTNCGPRFTIVRGLPYDRANTTMATFAMCDECRAEYEDPTDRRFHAQPIACPRCGPRLWLEDWGGVAGGEAIVHAGAIGRAAAALREGAIVAIRGLGCFHLACDATNPGAIARLRARKRRDAKPLALLVEDLADVWAQVWVDALERAAFEGPDAPIVVLRRRADARDPLPDALAPGLDTLGVMRAYTPLHLLLVRAVGRPLVMTSGNLGREPPLTDNAEARERLRGVAELALLHDRPIHQRIDDSVVRVIAGRARLLRRARGHAPAPLCLPAGFEAAPAILAFGAEQRSSFCLLGEGAALLAAHQGDLDELQTFEAYAASLALHQALLGVTPRCLAADLHAEYASTKLALDHAKAHALPLVRVQHHHAHVAACLAEQGWPLDAGPVLGVALDGLGLGLASTGGPADAAELWGGELLLADYRGFRRLGSLAAVALPGGERAVMEPWRSLYAHLRASFGDALEGRLAPLALARRFASKPTAAIDRMLASGLHCPLASSTGRLFDAVAAALELGFDASGYTGEPAMRLEALAGREAIADHDAYPFARVDAGELVRLDPTPMWRALLDDLEAARPASQIAARFHLGLAIALADLAVELARGRTDTVVLVGGCLQNAILLEQLAGRVAAAGLRCLTCAAIPSHDGGVALGQAMIAAAHQLTSP